LSSTDETFDRNRRYFGSIPRTGEEYVCPLCLGPVNPGFTHCYGCSRLRASAPASLLRCAVPMTSAAMPSPWYTRLRTYKRGQPEHAEVLTALCATFLAVHAQRLDRLLGGECDLVTVVPSKRGRRWRELPLRRALSRVPEVRGRLGHALDFIAGATLQRHQYEPGAFAAGAEPVGGRRVLLIEDIWVTGATALSAAGALLREGATAVAVVPLARAIDKAFWEGSPYLDAMAEPYDPGHWPR
jgi:predicted amidophosphoribosyltransferase